MGSRGEARFSVSLRSAPKSRAATESSLLKVVSSSFSESAYLDFKMRSSSFLERAASADQCLLFLDVSEDGSMTETLGKGAASLRRVIG